ncbi:MAG: DUF4823 domain-containing protein [Alphaproteobacteria bacterium]|nr:DUF4823 domain-containing protein [Alphaproteobacteria bacterium]
MKKLSITTLLISLFVTSCTWVGTSKQIRVFNKDNPINTQSSFYLNYPKNGFQKTFLTKNLEENPDSAKEVVATFRNGLSEKLGQLTIGEKNLKLDEVFKEASTRGSQYLIDIEIAQWKDASYFLCASSQSPNGQFNEPASIDTVDLTISIYDVKTKKLLNKQTIDNRGCPIVIGGMIPVGKNSPSSRLSSMLADWLNNIR